MPQPVAGLAKHLKSDVWEYLRGPGRHNLGMLTPGSKIIRKCGICSGAVAVNAKQNFTLPRLVGLSGDFLYANCFFSLSLSLSLSASFRMVCTAHIKGLLP